MSTTTIKRKIKLPSPYDIGAIQVLNNRKGNGASVECDGDTTIILYNHVNTKICITTAGGMFTAVNQHDGLRKGLAMLADKDCPLCLSRGTTTAHGTVCLCVRNKANVHAAARAYLDNHTHANRIALKNALEKI